MLVVNCYQPQCADILSPDYILIDGNWRDPKNIGVIVVITVFVCLINIGPSRRGGVGSAIIVVQGPRTTLANRQSADSYVIHQTLVNFAR